MWYAEEAVTLERMIGVLKQAQVGVPVAEVIRKAGISEQTFYRWKAKYAGLEVDEVRKMAQLQEENLRLKQLVAELTLDKTRLQDVLSKNGEAFAAWADGGSVGWKLPVSERHACRVYAYQERLTATEAALIHGLSFG